MYIAFFFKCKEGLNDSICIHELHILQELYNNLQTLDIILACNFSHFTFMVYTCIYMYNDHFIHRALT